MRIRVRVRVWVRVMKKGRCRVRVRVSVGLKVQVLEVCGLVHFKTSAHTNKDQVGRIHVRNMLAVPID